MHVYIYDLVLLVTFNNCDLVLLVTFNNCGAGFMFSVYSHVTIKTNVETHPTQGMCK